MAGDISPGGEQRCREFIAARGSIVRHVMSRTTHGSVMEDALRITNGEASSGQTSNFGADVSRDLKEASTSLSKVVAAASGSESPGAPIATDQIGKNVASPSRGFPSLKNTLAVRMAQRAKLSEPSPAFTATSGMAPTAATTAIRTIIEKAVLKAGSARAAHTVKANPYPRQSSKKPLVIAGVIAAFAAVFVTGLFSGLAFHAASNASIATAISATPAPSDLVWPDLLEPGVVSPRGQSSAGVASGQAFKLADARLHGVDGQADADEARFWLRVGIADALADDRLRWALTQLGTLYARPQASPADFAAARAVWEVAAAKKDPVALCFLAKLDEGGHGAPSNKATALKLYQQAKDAGGCTESDQAIERLSR